MKIAIITQDKPCFPRVISEGLRDALINNNCKVELIHAIPFLMRSLPLKKKPIRWHANFNYRLRQKIKYIFHDYFLVKKLQNFDIIIVAESYANLFWENYLYIEILRKKTNAKIISYSDSPLNAAPINKLRWLKSSDFDESRFDANLFLTNTVEVYYPNKANQFTIGVNLSYLYKQELFNKNNILAVLDFPQNGYESDRLLQIQVLNELGIQTLELKENYSREDILKIYQSATFFFLSSPETFGLSIAECLSFGTLIFTPSSSWPMAWRLNKNPKSNEDGFLPSMCFKVYGDEANLKNILNNLIIEYDFNNSPQNVIKCFRENYTNYFEGDRNQFEAFLNFVKTK
jgi:hypothetical protein